MQSVIDFYLVEHGNEPFLSKDAILKLIAKRDTQHIMESVNRQPMNESYPTKEKNLSVHLGV